jgi:hypothetical protein
MLSIITQFCWDAENCIKVSHGLRWYRSPKSPNEKPFLFAGSVSPKPVRHLYFFFAGIFKRCLRPLIRILKVRYLLHGCSQPRNLPVDSGRRRRPPTAWISCALCKFNRFKRATYGGYRSVVISSRHRWPPLIKVQRRVLDSLSIVIVLLRE